MSIPQYTTSAATGTVNAVGAFTAPVAKPVIKAVDSITDGVFGAGVTLVSPLVGGKVPAKKLLLVALTVAINAAGLSMGRSFVDAAPSGNAGEEFKVGAVAAAAGIVISMFVGRPVSNLIPNFRGKNVLVAAVITTASAAAVRGALKAPQSDKPWDEARAAAVGTVLSLAMSAALGLGAKTVVGRMTRATLVPLGAGGMSVGV